MIYHRTHDGRPLRRELLPAEEQALTRLPVGYGTVQSNRGWGFGLVRMNLARLKPAEEKRLLVGIIVGIKTKKPEMGSPASNPSD